MWLIGSTSWFYNNKVMKKKGWTRPDSGRRAYSNSVPSAIYTSESTSRKSEISREVHKGQRRSGPFRHPKTH